MKHYTILILIISCFLTGCNTEKTARESIDTYPELFPDYTFTAVPVNIAPLNFKIRDAQSIQVDFFLDGNKVLAVRGKNKIKIPQKKWHALLQKAAGNSLSLQVSVWDKLHPEGVRYKPFDILISPDEIDPYIAYRLIEPGYESWGQMGIYQRELSSFREKAVITNALTKNECVNCHSFRGYSANNFMFHARCKDGGTVVVRDNKPVKIKLSKREPGLEGSYPYWHPSGKYIVFSSNSTRQAFHAWGEQPVEVYDLQSDLMIYDVANDRVLTDRRFTSKDSSETFPCWSADGQMLYFCRAKTMHMPFDHKKLKYAIYRVPFSEQTGQLDETEEIIYDPQISGGSASFPRISPDGNYLLFTEAACGTFPIWHKEADLVLVDLRNLQRIDTKIINSDETESYHSWSSNGRWILFSSRRIDGLYTRLYIAWFDKDGQLHKPFLLPQQNPDHNLFSLKSYNIPEFTDGAIRVSSEELEKAILH